MFVVHLQVMGLLGLNIFFNQVFELRYESSASEDVQKKREPLTRTLAVTKSRTFRGENDLGIKTTNRFLVPGSCI